MAERKLSMGEAVELTGFSKDVIRRSALDRQLPYYRAGERGHFFFTERELLAWIDSMRVEAQS